jgi:anti-anti-sigma factor
MLVEMDMHPGSDLALLRCRGRLVLGEGAALVRAAARRALLEGHAVALDLAPVTQMDAHGAGVLAELSAIARETGRALLLAGASHRVRRMLHLTRLDALIPSAWPAHADAAAEPASLRIA